MNDKLIKSVIGDESDLICIECKREKKARMSAYCLKCKVKLEPNFLARFNLFKRRTNLEVFTCFGCNKDFIEKSGYVTKNLLYLCKQCYNLVYNRN